MRIASTLALIGTSLALAGCGGDAARAGQDAAPDTVAEGSSPADPSGGARSIPCAPYGASGFDSTCRVERTEIDGTTQLTVFHPDGGFRRFEQRDDGSGLSAVAGADEVTQSLSGDILEIAIADNRYRFPAAAR